MHTANQQDGKQAPAAQRSANDDTEGWKAHWEKQGQPWRIEPEIDTKRQEELDKRRKIVPDIEKGIYPFKDIKLNRADVEWLLATHENGRGPIDWDDGSQRERRGLDLRGADLCQVNLAYLPLACLCGSLTWNEWMMATEEQQRIASVQMKKANVGNAKLAGANLYGAELKEIALYGTDLRSAGLGWAKLEGADLGYANLEGVLLFMANLAGADLREASLAGADLRKASIKGADLSVANLEGAKISNVILADMSRIGPWLVDVQWGSTNLGAVDWSQVATLSEEYRAQQKKTSDGNTKDAASRLYENKTAVRANRQLAVVLQDQGLSEDAARFAHRSQVCKQRLLFLQLLEQIAGEGKLRWLLQTPRIPQDYLTILAAATMVLVFTFILGAYLIISPKLQIAFPPWADVVTLSVSACVCLSLLVIYQLFVRLLLLFLLLSALDLLLLFLVFFLLVSTLINSEWRLNLFFLLLTVLMITTVFWVVHTEPFASRFGIQISFSDRVKILRKNSIKVYRAFFRPWLVPFAQLQVNYGRYIFALFLNVLAGYGYRPGRSLLCYLVVIFGFATSYYAIGHIPLLPNAFVLSLTSFHGRGFFPGLESKTTLDNPLVVLAAIEAVVGLFIEISFIATFTQRFFGK